MAVETKRYRISGTPIEVRDKGGKLFAKLAPDRRHIYIVQKDKSVELMVNENGQLEQIIK